MDRGGPGRVGLGGLDAAVGRRSPNDDGLGVGAGFLQDFDEGRPPWMQNMPSSLRGGLPSTATM